jgi:type IV pilus assembly protein PilX
MSAQVILSMKNSLRHSRYASSRQRGITMVIVLIFLVVLTILGITGMRTTRLQEQMAGSRYERVTAMSAAHAGLSDSREFILALLDPNDPAWNVVDTNEFLGKPEEGWTINEWVEADTDWTPGGNVVAFGRGNKENYTIGRIASNPTYIVQRLPDATTQVGLPFQRLRATVRATGVRSENSVYLQTQISLPVSTVNQ